MVYSRLISFSCFIFTYSVDATNQENKNTVKKYFNKTFIGILSKIEVKVKYFKCKNFDNLYTSKTNKALDSNIIYICLRQHAGGIYMWMHIHTGGIYVHVVSIYILTFVMPNTDVSI